MTIVSHARPGFWPPGDGKAQTSDAAAATRAENERKSRNMAKLLAALERRDKREAEEKGRDGDE